MKILIANLGSTSFKYRLFDLPQTPSAVGAEEELARGGVERIGDANSRVYASIDSTKLENELLKNQQTKLVTDKSDLIKKNETAKSHLKALLERINNMKDDGKE